MERNSRLLHLVLGSYLTEFYQFGNKMYHLVECWYEKFESNINF